jgi:hypothetical protein
MRCKYVRLGRPSAITRTLQELLADYDNFAIPSNKPEQKFKHLKIAMEFVKNNGTSPSDRRTTMSAIRAFYRYYLRSLQGLDTAAKDEIYEKVRIADEGYAKKTNASAVVNQNLAYTR